MAALGNIASVWNTIRELNVGEIRQQAEQPWTLALIGETAPRNTVAEVLRGTPGRFQAASRDALLVWDLLLPRERQNDLASAGAVILVLDGARPLPPEAVSTADKLVMVRQPRVVAVIGRERLPQTVDGREADLGGAKVVFLPQLTPQSIRDQLIPALVEVLPEGDRLAAGRRLPGLRDAIAQTLIGETSFSNATYALTSSLPELIPLLNLPLNAADMLVLTKNQALLTYKLGLAYGAPPDFQAQMREIMPVIGSGFVWRQLARELVGLIPGFGMLPKVAVAYAGTYAVGHSAALWYGKGEVLSHGGLRQLYQQALALGKQRARELIDRRKHAPQTGPTVRLEHATPSKPSVTGRIRRLLGGKPRPPTLPPPSAS
ncbi:MAG: hypothetical protein H0X37_09210 [Herpetosiphonaceae bacterium]|nr:hypothetical protein [Herpetosiphonaceae bacterium]